MMSCYIPDLTERFPEGFGGVDMCEPYDPEYAMWETMEREYSGRYENCEDDDTPDEV